MSTKTRYYSQKLTASATEQTFDLPRLSFVRVLNYGNEDVLIEFDNDINDNSVILPVRGDIQIPADLLNLHYKVNSGSSASLYIYGLKHIKS